MAAKTSQGSAVGVATASGAVNVLIVAAGSALGASSAIGAVYALDAALAVYSVVGAPVAPPYFHLSSET